MLNSAIEATVDRVGRKWPKLAGRAKGIGSAAIARALRFAVLIWTRVLTGR
ncbi:MAG: diacylglycerol kinase [Acidiferrobacterales bacterium]